MNAKGDRLSSLDGILNSGPRTSVQPASAEPSPSSDSEPDTSETSPTNDRAKDPPLRPRRSGTVSSRPTGGRHRVPFKLAPELKRTLADRARRDDQYQSDIVKAAIEVAVESSALEGEFEPAPTAGLFARSATTIAQPSVPSEIHLHRSELKVLDELVTRFGAKDRTALIVKALELYL